MKEIFFDQDSILVTLNKSHAGHTHTYIYTHICKYNNIHTCKYHNMQAYCVTKRRTQFK